MVRNFSPLLTRQNFFALSLEKYSEGRFRIYEISGQHIPQIIVSFANDFIYANDFICVPLFFLIIKKNQNPKLFAPLRDGSKNFRPPPFATQIFCPPKLEKSKVPMIPSPINIYRLFSHTMKHSKSSLKFLAPLCDASKIHCPPICFASKIFYSPEICRSPIA